MADLLPLPAFLPVAGVVPRALAALAPSRVSPPAPASPEGRMRGALYAQHGPATLLELRDDLPCPGASPQHALVRVAASGVNPVDCKVRHHAVLPPALPLPKIPGTDLAGEVVQAPSGSGFKPGDRVYAMMPLLGARWGACAELAPVEPRFLARAPEGLSWTELAALPLVGLTVLQALRPALAALGETRGRAALVQAGAGGTGSMAVQLLAKVHGMRVIATCSPENDARVRALGADDTIDYRRYRFEDKVQEMDLVFDPLGYLYAQRTLHSRVLRPGGHYVHLASSPWSPGDRRTLGFIPESTPLAMLSGYGRQLGSRLGVPLGLSRAWFHHVFVHPSGADLAELARHVEAGQLAPAIDRVFPLEDIAEAHRHVEGGHTRGKVVLSISELAASEGGV